MCLNFKAIFKDDIETIASYFNLRSNRTCDSVFLDAFLWKDHYNVQFAIWDNRALFLNMKIKGKIYSSLPLCKEEDLKEAFKVITKYFNEVLNEKIEVYLGDEEGMNNLELDTNLFKIEEMEDLKDYLYSAEALKNLSGKKLRKKKNHINAFLRDNEGDYEYKGLCCKNKDDINKFLDIWTEEREISSDLDGEIKGIEEILKNCQDLKVIMAGILIKGKLEAFTIGSYNKLEKMAIIHIEKANHNIRGLYPFINQQFIINEFPDAVLVNREDDMGLEGLRKAKLSYDPIDYARKYRIIQL